MQWVATRHIQALDAFSWLREKGRNGDSEQFFGHIRVAPQDAGPLIAASGQQGIFISAPRSAPEHCLPRCEVVWIDRAPQEKHGAYLERTMRMADAHGIAMSGTRLGWRRPLAKDETPTRIWQITEVPAEWDHVAVKGMLEVAFVDPVVISHRWQKGYVSLRFRAKIKAGHGDRDVVPIVVEHLGANITLWATYAPARKPQTVQKSVYTHSVPVVAAEAVPAFTKKTESVPVSTASPPSEDGKEQSQTKQAKQEMRSFPADLSKVDCAKDCNCVLHAFSKALKHFKDEDRHPRVLRAEMVTHMLKHERYSRTWDKLDPSGNPLTSFEEYCKLIERDGVHLGELEISALAHITHFKVVVVPQGLDFQPAWNVKEKKLVVLWYSASHIDLALPKGDDAKKYPEDYHKITSGPVCGFRFGTSPASSCATASRVRVPSCISGASQSSCKHSAKVSSRQEAQVARLPGLLHLRVPLYRAFASHLLLQSPLLRP